MAPSKNDGPGTFVADGDSITFGLDSHAPYTDYLTLSGGPWLIKNVAVSGSASVNCLQRAPMTVDPLFSPGPRQVVAIWAGTNDSIPEEQTWANLQSYAAARKTVGWKSIVVTMLSRVGRDDRKNQLNALIRENWHVSFDAIADIAGDDRLGADGAYADATYFLADGTHPTKLSQETIVAPFMSQVINQL